MMDASNRRDVSKNMDDSNSRHVAQLGCQQLKGCMSPNIMDTGKKPAWSAGGEASMAGMPTRQEASKAGMPARQECQQGRNDSQSNDSNERRCCKKFLGKLPHWSGMF
jgi:hypothetical protein